MTQTNMQTFGEFLNSLSPEINQKYQVNLMKRQEQKTENALKFREKYGFELDDYDIEKVSRAEAENAICAACSGFPCKKGLSQNPKWQNVIKADPLRERIDVAVKRCKYAESAGIQKQIEKKFSWRRANFFLQLCRKF